MVDAQQKLSFAYAYKKIPATEYFIIKKLL
jgi:hypothetical protein